jgi:hypothetical protein
VRFGPPAAQEFIGRPLHKAFATSWCGSKSLSAGHLWLKVPFCSQGFTRARAARRDSAIPRPFAATCAAAKPRGLAARLDWIMTNATASAAILTVSAAGDARGASAKRWRLTVARVPASSPSCRRAIMVPSTGCPAELWTHVP